jgi:protoporphyrinogen/coproporphyrinogen III oxidase
MKKVAIVGGGISGLLTAYYAQKNGFQVTLYEKEKTLGGKLQTIGHVKALLETAANGILADKRVESLCADIQVELIPTLKASKARWIYKNGKARRWILGLFPSIRLLFFLLNNKKKIKKRIAGQNLYSWGERQLGRNTTDYLLDPACQGIFGVSTKDLSAALVLDYFFARKPNPKGKYRGTVAPRKGMGSLVDGLRVHLLKNNVEIIEKNIENLVDIMLTHDHVVVATDIESAGRLLDEAGDARGARLSQVPMVDLLSVNVLFAENKTPYPGFGVLFPPAEPVRALGVLQNSFIFPERSKDCISETWIYGGVDSGLFTLSDKELQAVILEDRKKVFQDDQQPLDIRFNRWKKAIPLYGVKLEDVLLHLPPRKNNVHLMGNYLGQLGLNRLFQISEELVSTLKGT